MSNDGPRWTCTPSSSRGNQTSTCRGLNEWQAGVRERDDGAHQGTPPPGTARLYSNQKSNSLPPSGSALRPSANPNLTRRPSSSAQTRALPTGGTGIEVVDARVRNQASLSKTPRIRTRRHCHGESGEDGAVPVDEHGVGDVDADHVPPRSASCRSLTVGPHHRSAQWPCASGSRRCRATRKDRSLALYF